MPNILPKLDIPKKRIECSGFTLLEVLLVITIISVIAVVLLTRVPSLKSYNERVETDTLKSHLRYAQNRAMNKNSAWGLEFLSASQYRLYSVEEAGTLQNYFPGSKEGAVTVSLSDLKVQTSPSIQFDSMGSPGPADIAVNNGSGNVLFVVTAETGFIE